jgi:hypothetical protein
MRLAPWRLDDFGRDLFARQPDVAELMVAQLSELLALTPPLRTNLQPIAKSDKPS